MACGTLTADGLIRGSSTIQIFGVTLERRDATLAALFMVLIRVLTILVAALISARFSAAVTGIAQTKVMAAYLRGTYSARSARPR